MVRDTLRPCVNSVITLRNEERGSRMRNEDSEQGTMIWNEERGSETRNENLGRGTKYPTTLCK